MTRVMNPAKDQISQAKFIFFAVVTGAVTLLLFPAISYTSVIFYGVPAAAFILLGYGVWLYLMPRTPKMAMAFSLGFIPPVALCLMILVAIKPLYVGMILLPVACFWFMGRFARRSRLK
jgi:hypothetical protein